MTENNNFLTENANNAQTKVCFICGERHPITVHKMTDAFFVVMDCPKELVKLGGRTVSVENFVFLKKHILG